jgi:hypothetical protein
MTYEYLECECSYRRTDLVRRFNVGQELFLLTPPARYRTASLMLTATQGRVTHAGPRATSS